MVYNLSTINATGLASLAVGVNDTLMFGWLGTFLMIAIYAIFFIAFFYRTQDFKATMNFSALFTAVFSIMLRGLGLIPDLAVLIIWIIAAISLAVSYMTKD